MRYEATFGPNTKQWWIFDSENEKLIDPPIHVLNLLKDYPSNTADDIEVQADILEFIANKNPDWINDEDYIYDGDMEI